MPLIQLLIGAVFLYFGAEWLVGGSSNVALRLRLPRVIVGLTVVAYGTSMPELVVGVKSSLAGAGGVALGNVVGSNIANVGLILAVAALIKPADVEHSLGRRELPMLGLGAALLPLAMWDGELSRIEGSALLVVALVYTAWMVRSALSAGEQAHAAAELVVSAEAATAAGGLAPGPSLGRASFVALLGLVVLLAGGSLFVDGAVAIAKALQVSDRMVGLTIVAVGTSLPELVTSVIAALRGHSDIAVGNVVGSNVFNVFLCLGGAALARPISVDLGEQILELATLGVMTALLCVFIRSARKVTRAEGGLVLGLYVAFMGYLIWRG